MSTWLKRLRGALGMGAIWSAIWSVVGAGIILWPGGVRGHPFLDFFLVFVAQYAALGLIGGVTFSAVLGLVEKRLSFAEMTLARFAAWGACGGFMMWALSDTVGNAVLETAWGASPPVLNWIARTPGITFVLLGALSAAMVLALARLVDASGEAESPDDEGAELDRLYHGGAVDGHGFGLAEPRAPGNRYSASMNGYR